MGKDEMKNTLLKLIRVMAMGTSAFRTSVFGTWIFAARAFGIALIFLLVIGVGAPLSAQSKKPVTDEELKVFLQSLVNAANSLKAKKKIEQQSVEQFLTTLEKLLKKFASGKSNDKDLTEFVETWEAALAQHGQALPSHKAAYLGATVQDMRRLLRRRSDTITSFAEVSKLFNQGHRASMLILQGGDVEEVGWVEFKLAKKSNQFVLSYQLLNLLSDDFFDNNLGVSGKKFWLQRHKSLVRLTDLQNQLLNEQEKLNEDFIKLVLGSEQLKEFHATKKAEYDSRVQGFAEMKARQQVTDRSVANSVEFGPK